MTKTKLPEVIWDRHTILAEIRRRGMTLSGIAEDAGLEGSACRHGIARRNRNGGAGNRCSAWHSLRYPVPRLSRPWSQQ